MAAGQNVKTFSVVAGATFSTGDLYKGVVIDSSGHAVLPNTTGNVLAAGVLYSVTNTTSSAGSEAVSVAYDGVLKVRMAASTMSNGQPVGFSTVGLGIAPTSDSYTFGTVITGTSGAIDRIYEVLVTRGPLSTP